MEICSIYAREQHGKYSASDHLHCHFRAGGTIVKAFATDFESLSQDGKLHVIVQNTGLVTADYHVSFSYDSFIKEAK